MSDNTTKAQCKICFHFLSTNSNSTLKNNISHPHCEAFKMVSEAGKSSMAKHDRLATSEYERYVESDFVSHLSTEELAGYDVLGFWNANESTFPVISQIARDILSVQATSVASESAFTTSGRVLSIRRTRLTLASLEMCMCLKYHMDAAERVQHTSNPENFLDFEEEILEEEVQEHEAIALSEVALDEAASEARSSGGEEIYDMTLSESD
ncbi:zinc finger BED domain-containing protein RICESLEEPER 2 [Tanacetum coccineum]